jgi:hypothetical protein
VQRSMAVVNLTDSLKDSHNNILQELEVAIWTIMT